MGQAVLTHHKLEDKRRFDSHAFFGVRGEDDLQLPVVDAAFIAKFSAVCGLKRSSETGLSVVVPFPEPAVTHDRIVEFVVRNYFFPILFGRLRVTVGDAEINTETFPELAKRLGGPRFTQGKLAEFIQTVDTARRGGSQIPLVLTPDWPKDIERAIGTEHLAEQRKRLMNGELIFLRAQLLLKRKNGEEVRTHFDMFLLRAPEDQSEALFVRDSITLPGEARYFRGRHIYAALVADDRDLCAFLGDAENPAHTSWSATAEKLSKNWRNPQTRLKEIRESLQRVYNVLTSAVETVDNDALASFFSSKSEEGGKKARPPGPIVRPPVITVPPQAPKVYRLNRQIGGFNIRPGPGITEEALPLTLHVRVAYDVRSGNPFSKHSPYDFDLTRPNRSIKAAGAQVSCTAANVIELEIASKDFEVEVIGFDPNRDLIVDPRVV